MDTQVPKRVSEGRRHPVHPLLNKISCRCHDRDDPKTIRYRCLGTNCPRSWALPRNNTRILKHACHCHRLPAQLRAEANSLKSDESLGALVEQMEHDEEVERVSAKRVKVEGENSPNGGMEATFLDIHVGEMGRRRLQAMLDLA